MNAKRPVNAGDKKIDLFLMIAAHTTLLIGIYQWIAGPWGLKNIMNIGMGEVMKNSAFRFWAVEHLVGMLIAIVLITVGRGAVKRATSAAAHKKAFWCFLIALVVVLASVPWPFREAIARPLFPGMH
ncbi:MAG: hypothetical protein P0Y53_22425 [Candidatus Pseudobacter hemicellulosilyticus]|uniref:Cytochrome B n=1 Tax=Candidatus Pseudobacter hemicellulosilyticus TaxID=3121375 RepID=A0AAJ6BHJ8_9BACT|nr:MAG: hypothetical protein P0Y53_22425 [Pseudobacter sp.]